MALLLLRPQRSLLMRDLVEHLVGHRVVDLPRAAEPPADRREEHHEPQIIATHGFEQRAQTTDLRIENAVKLLRRLVFDAVVGEPGMPSVTIGSMAPVEAELLAASGAATPLIEPLPYSFGFLAVILVMP